MAGCDDLDGALRDMQRRMRRMEQRLDNCCGSGGRNGGGGGNPPLTRLDIEEIIRKAVDRAYRDERWKACERILEKIIRGKR